MAGFCHGGNMLGNHDDDGNDRDDDDDDNADDGNTRDDDIGEPLSWKIGCVPERVQPWLWHHYDDYGEDADDIVDNDCEWQQDNVVVFLTDNC